MMKSSIDSLNKNLPNEINRISIIVYMLNLKMTMKSYASGARLSLTGPNEKPVKSGNSEVKSLSCDTLI